MNTKRKKIYTNPLAELQFVSTLELEQSTDLIANLGDLYPVTITERTPHKIDFDIVHAEGTIEGTLHRWHGNETRINCSGDVMYAVADDQKVDTTPTLLLMGMIFCGSLLIIGQSSLAFLGIALLIIFGTWFRPDVANRDPKLRPLFRERDAIFQHIIRSFRASGDVSAL